MGLLALRQHRGQAVAWQAGQPREPRVYSDMLLTVNLGQSILHLYHDEMKNIRSNITPEGKGVYLPVYPELSPNTDSI